MLLLKFHSPLADLIVLILTFTTLGVTTNTSSALAALGLAVHTSFYYYKCEPQICFLIIDLFIGVARSVESFVFIIISPTLLSFVWPLSFLYHCLLHAMSF